MRDIRPGYWSSKGTAEVVDARSYDKREFRDWSFGSAIHGPWRAPLPRPPAGQVILPVSAGDYPRRSSYRVQGRARGALASLRRILGAAQLGGRLEWAAAQSCPVATDLPLKPDPDNSVVHIAATPFAGEASKVRSQRDGKQAVRGSHVIRQPRCQQPAPARDLLRVCLTAAKHPSVVREAVDFVSKYGDLVHDFGQWCADSGCAGDTGNWLSLPEARNERLLWQQGWRRWAVGVYERFQQLQRDRPVPAPIAFYIWAALMLTGLSDHPEWPSSRLFLANRLASLRLVQFWNPSYANRREQADRTRADGEQVDPREERIRLFTAGELLDYLALSAAFRVWPVIETRCPACAMPFSVEDKRRRYCSDECRAAAPALWARKYRDRHRADTDQVGPGPALHAKDETAREATGRKS